ncbi:mechanosensitive ion channel family protein [Phenylobacterium sp.]|uniref:mechanosensitive ion channel family protein n=1 Tax=Phenylobacterium sp. TaxID=1871053 RepID=UPI00286CBD52|nr:mechanosensitive ion channel family protein [Phenylobacterium sp.]
MQAPTESPPAFTETLSRALSGDEAMRNGLVALVGAYSVRVIVAVLILALTLWASRRAADLVGAGVARFHVRAHPGDTTLQNLASTVARYVVIVIGFIAVLQQIGVQATSVIAVLGAASLAIGLALQGTLGNVAAGVMILLLRPYRIGDKVELNGKQGVVKGLDLFNTEVVDYDGLTIFFPNGKVFGDTIVNITRLGRRRLEIVVGIDYDDDVDVAIALMLELAGADRRVLATPAPWAKVTALADSSVNVTLRCWTSPDDWMNTRFDLLKLIKQAFEARGLSFPYPHQVSIEKTPRSEPFAA